MLRQLRLEYCNVEHGQLIVVLQLHFLSKNKKYCLPTLWNKKEKRKKSWAKQWMLKKSIPLQLLIVVANFAQTNKNMYLLEKKNRYFPSLSRGKNKFVFSNQHMFCLSEQISTKNGRHYFSFSFPLLFLRCYFKM